MKIYRKIYEETYGALPKDINGRIYEIHHKDGNHNNNEISNLIALTINEHFEIHKRQGDWAACSLIAKRMKLSPSEIRSLQLGIKRPGIGGRKPGFISENKGKLIHSIEQKQQWSIKRKNVIHSSKLNVELVKEIRSLYNLNIPLDNVGKILSNGKILTYEQAFCKEYSKIYNVHCNNIRKVVRGISWKNV